MTARLSTSVLSLLAICGVSVLSLLLLSTVPAWSQDRSMPSGHEGMLMPGDNPADPQTPEKKLADKRESEFNHHLIGLLVLLGGLFLAVENELSQRWPFIRFVWPAMLLLGGVFVLIWSDTELWPFGPQTWGHALANNREVLQHKIFALLLLVLGFIELQRVRGRLQTVWASWSFPLLAIAGSVLLLFHRHQAGEHGPHHMEVMARIQSEHLSYAITGVGISLAKLFSDLRSSWQSVFQRLWPASLIVLGVLLLTYAE